MPTSDKRSKVVHERDLTEQKQEWRITLYDIDTACMPRRKFFMFRTGLEMILGAFQPEVPDE